MLSAGGGGGGSLLLLLVFFVFLAVFGLLGDSVLLLFLLLSLWYSHQYRSIDKTALNTYGSSVQDLLSSGDFWGGKRSLGRLRLQFFRRLRARKFFLRLAHLNGLKRKGKG